MKSKIYNTILLLLFCIFPVFAYDTSGEAIAEGRKKLNTQDTKGAFADAEEAIKLSKNTDEKIAAFFFKASVFERVKEHENAVLTFQEVLKLADAPLLQKVNACMWSANNYQRIKEYAKARAEYEKVLAFADIDDRTKINAMFQSAGTFGYEKQFEKAHEAYGKILALSSLKPNERANAHRAVANVYTQEKKNDLAEQEYRKILQFADSSPNDKYNAHMELIRIQERLKKWEKVIEFADSALADEALNGFQKVMISNMKTNALFNLWKFDDAVAIYETLIKTPDFKIEWKYEALMGLGRFYERKSEFDNATKVYCGIIEDKNHSPKNRLNAANAAAKAFVQDIKYEDAKKGYETLLKDDVYKGDMLSELYGTYANVLVSAKEFDKAREACLKGMQLEKISIRTQQDRQRQMVTISFEEKDFDRMKKDIDQYLSDADFPNRDKLICDYAATMFARMKYPEAIAAYEMIVSGCFTGFSTLWQREPHFSNFLCACILSGDDAKFTKYAKMFSENSLVPLQLRIRFALLAGDLNNTDKTVKDVFAAFEKAGEEITAEVKAKALSDAAKLLISCGVNAPARMFYELREKLFKQTQRNMLTVKFVENAPSDVGSWMNSPILKDPKAKAVVNHIYGEKEAANLYTDVMAAGRIVGDPKVEADKETYFYMVCDEYGLKLFFIGVDSKYKDVINKKLPGSGYEMYIALGENAPSYQWLFDQPGEKLYIPPWNSPHKYYRNLGDYVTISTRPVENGFATSMNFSWELAYDRLPELGDTWPFELIRWTRAGGVTWGGKEVWQIGNWGRLKFELTNKQLVAIKRNLIHKALAKYAKEFIPRNGGTVAIWRDPEMGDPEFYEKALKPFVEELETYKKMVADDMSDDTVDLIYEKAVPAWMDFQYFASEKRQAYLLEKITFGK